MKETDFYKAGNATFKKVADYWFEQENGLVHGSITRQYCIDAFLIDADNFAEPVPAGYYEAMTDEQIRQQYVEFYIIEGV